MCHFKASLLQTGKRLIVQERGSLFCKSRFPPNSMIQRGCKKKCVLEEFLVIFP